MSKARLLEKNKDVAYPIEVNNAISKAHPYNEEIALLRKAINALANGQALPQEYVAYNNEVEAKKAEVRRVCGIS